MPNVKTLSEMVFVQAQRRPDAVAILGPGRRALTYGELGAQIEATVHAVNGFGIGRNDRVAAVLQNGPEAAVASLGIGSAAAYAPLSPALTAREYEEALSATDTKALVILAGAVSPARDVARDRSIPILELATAAGAAAGTFSLTGAARALATAGGVAGADDVGLVLRSSSTTSRPKVFSYKQSDLIVRAAAFAVRITQLTEADRCLNLLPLFHSYGMSAAVLGSLWVGASLICVPGLSLPEFFGWLADFRPTWYAAMPAMHQAILEQVALFPDIVGRHSLRLIGSGAAPLSTELRNSIEATFGVPVVNVYGSTETSAVAATPLPPAIRKPGSIGVAVPWAAVIDQQGAPLPSGMVGEVAVPERYVIRPDNSGPGVFPVVNGWYPTGDLGYLDDERYLFLVGRTNEQINRGGEKVAPYEVEEELVRHPAVAQAAVFAMPDPKLGQDVAAAVVLRDGARATSVEIRNFVTPRLARFKVPRVVLVVDRIPVGPTGKIQRRHLAELLRAELDHHLQAARTGVDATRQIVRARDALEQNLVDHWESLLAIRPIGVTDDFFALGGDSLAALRLLAQLDVDFGVKLSEAVLSGVTTIEGLAAVLRDANWEAHWSSLVPLKLHSARPPLFVCLHGGLDSVVGYRHVVQHLPDDQPMIGVRIRGEVLGQTRTRPIEELAADYLREIRTAQPGGPYHLLGYSAAGLVAFEVARQLVNAGEKVAFLGMVDTRCQGWHETAPHLVRRHLRRLSTLGVTEIVPYLAACVTRNASPWGKQLRTRFYGALTVLGVAARRRTATDDPLTTKAALGYVPRRYPGKITLFLAADPARDLELVAEVGWKQFAGGGFEAREVPGDHGRVLRAQDGEPFARALADCLLHAQTANNHQWSPDHVYHQRAEALPPERTADTG